MDDRSDRTACLASSDDSEPRREGEQLLQRSSFEDAEWQYNERSSTVQEPQLEGGHEPRPADGLPTSASGSSNTSSSKITQQETLEKTQKVQSTKTWVSVIHDWFWELVAWLFGTLAIVAILLLLAFFNQKFLSQWKSVISINTMVAVLSQAAVSALLVPVAACVGQMKWVWYQGRRELVDLEAFDLASRGPEGSLRFLFRVRRLLCLASFGALITILMLGFQPFVQQAVNADGVRWKRLQHNATIPRAAQFNDTDILGAARMDAQDGPVTSMEEPVATGFTGDDNTLSQISGSCPSSNCTWPPYTSLAFCSSVKDVTSTIVENCTQGSVSIDDGGDMRDFNSSCNVSTQALLSTEAILANYSITTPPNNLGLLFLGAPIFGVTQSSTINGSIYPVEPVFVDAVVLYMQQAPIAEDVASIYGFPPLAIPPVGKLAIQVTINLCVQTMATNMTNGTTHTEVLESTSSLHWNLDWDTNTFWPQANDETHYVVDLDSVRAVIKYFEDVVFYSSGLVLQGSTPLNGDAFTVVAKNLLGPGLDTFDPKLAFENIANRMNNVTTSMTNALRTQAIANGDEMVVGEAWTPANFIQVDFRWMAIPLVLWFSASIFFFATIIKTRTREVPPWKSSVIALLRLQDERGASGSVKDIQRDVRKLKAQLTYDGDAWRLFSVDSGVLKED